MPYPHSRSALADLFLAATIGAALALALCAWLVEEAGTPPNPEEVCANYAGVLRGNNGASRPVMYPPRAMEDTPGEAPGCPVTGRKTPSRP